ncbi:putative bifunctional diguanylate cyclase/phosphodiesterase [Consotaella salsifontis]|uniref:Diguanylate cyclase (GGDEF) domain-containing protein n=1 Tax=Consotaella salsifontis TaxID=1365950 RepID=A0A1T4L3F7_9HYPH|nr:EAL domain-containing protein [Consotaella salsifontis]SJZ49246.1 diguanylate cyclase (GGDEF) domain-containing protein [Consotaella salsifontis]
MEQEEATETAAETDEEIVLRSLFGDPIWFALGLSCVMAAAILSGIEARTRSVWWAVAALLFVTMLRLACMATFQRRRRLGIGHAARRWIRIYTVSSTTQVFAMSCWTLVVFWSSRSPVAELLSFGVCVGYLIGIQGRNFANTTVVRIQLAVAAPPIILALVLKEELAYGALCFFFSFLVASILRTSAKMNAMFFSTLAAVRKSRMLAETDPMTGLPNRSAMSDIVARSIASGGEPFALHFIDIDRFKHINDSLGHAAGDRLLSEVGARLVAEFKDEAVISRFAGDEFLILQRFAASAAGANAFAQRVLKALAQPVHLHGLSVVVDCCVGTALFPRDAADAASLTQRADTALLHAKRDGPGQHRMFSTQMATMEAERLAIETDLRTALERGDVTLAFQPIFDPCGERVLACEALARWNDPQRGAISPAKFLPVAEEAGLMNLVTDYTFALACRTAADWPDDVILAVNLSPGQLLRADLVQMIERVCAAANFPLTRLEIEITEDTLVPYEGRSLESLRRLKEQGIRLSLDDFGTGYSNLGRIVDLPIDKVKIDRSFVSAIESDARARALLDGAIRFIASLGLDIVVEGVETLGQLSYLQKQPNVWAIQGFIFGYPLPAEGIAELLDRVDAYARPEGGSAFLFGGAVASPQGS